MSKIKSNVTFFKEIANRYEDSIFEVLETKSNKIKKVIHELLINEAEKHQLKNSNSVQDNYYFSVKQRVKGKDSFYEKLIRKDIGLDIIKTIQYNGDSATINRDIEPITSFIYKIDDIIGIRIVTELKKDCQKVYELINNNSQYLEERNIKLSNHRVQPEPMKNGLDIYKIKGMLENTHAFELQIKSKIDEAWGDLDHTLFYKDYSISPIKDTVQVTMNNVGYILEKLETLLYDLRESSKKYNQVAEHIKFQTEINEKFGPQLFSLFNADLNLIEISDIILKMKNHFKLKGLGVAKKISFNHLDFTVTTPISRQFQNLRSVNHKLLIIESFYYHLINVKKSYKITLSQLNYEKTLSEFLEFLLSYNLQSIKTELDIKTIFEITANYISNPKIYVDQVKLKQTVELLELVSNTLIDNNLGSDTSSILNLLFITIYQGDIDSFIEVVLQTTGLDELRDNLNLIKDENSSEQSIIEAMNPIYEILAPKF